MVSDYEKALRLNVVMTERNQMIAMIRWTTPRDEFIKLNTDGACKLDGSAGCGGVIRGSQGEWIRGFAKNVG
ncbi:hypothetical protein TSUD_75660 [Trifolium subterraneum]|nr:hypothetical protein TSUD_75660 [Trifolium subterraneum]